MKIKFIHCRAALLLAVLLGFSFNGFSNAGQVNSQFLDQTTSHQYACNGRTVNVSARYNSANKDFRLISFTVENNINGSASDLTKSFDPFFKNEYAIRSLNFVCADGADWIFILINNRNPHDKNDKTRSETFTINEDLSMTEGRRF